MSIPQTFIQELLARVDIVGIVGRHVQLKKGGANFTGLCPFHSEKSPSFSVSPAKQFFHCFGCGKSGNAIGFLMDHTGMAFVEAVKDLAQQCGLQVPEDDVSPQDRAQAAQARAQQATLTSVLEKAASAYQAQLRGSGKTIDYLKGRGVSGEVAKTFGLGYAPEGWRALASVFPDYSDALLVDAGLVITGEQEDGVPDAQAKRYDRFRDRLMFPIRNVKGECIGFGGRVFGDEKPKYLNSPETAVFSKGRELYGLFEARGALREHGFALVTEGYMDVVALAQLGFANAVATLGTACTPDHLHKLFRFTDSVVFSFDGDAAGQRAARKALEIALGFASDTRSLKFLFLPAEHDPDSFIREHGQEGFAAALAKAMPLSKFLLQAAAVGCDLDTAEGLARMTSQAGPLWLQLPEGAFKRQMLAAIADAVASDARDLAEAWQPTSGRYKNNSYSGSKSLGRSPKTLKSNAQSAALALEANDGFAPASYPENPPHEADYSSSEPYFLPPPARARTGGAPRRTAGRVLPASREDRALRLLLTEPERWDLLSAEEHGLLTSLAQPHGPLFSWFESQLHEHGPQPWAALREGLRGHAYESHAVAQIAQMLVAATPTKDENADDNAAELRQLMNRLLVEHLKGLETQAIEAATSDPSALQRYRSLQARRRQLETS